MHLLFIDVETTGLNPATNHIVQLAARLRLPDQVADLNTYIQPTNFEIPEPARQIHRISTDCAANLGIPLPTALDALTPLVDLADAIVGHHVSFDVSFLIAEAIRAGRPDLAAAIQSLPQICTKQLSADYLHAQGQDNNRSATKLTRMFELLTQQPLADAHDAFTDVLACQVLHQQLVGSAA